VKIAMRLMSLFVVLYFATIAPALCFDGKPATASASCCVLYRIMDKGTVKLFCFAECEVKAIDDPRGRIVIVALRPDDRCLPGEWSLLNESRFAISYSYFSSSYTRAPESPICFTPICPRLSTARNDQSHPPRRPGGELEVRFRIPTPTKGFSVYIYCERVLPACEVCLLPGHPLMRLDCTLDAPTTLHIVPPANGYDRLSYLRSDGLKTQLDVCSFSDYLPTVIGTPCGSIFDGIAITSGPCLHCDR
jgi:hypothetical protein